MNPQSSSIPPIPEPPPPKLHRQCRTLVKVSGDFVDRVDVASWIATLTMNRATLPPVRAFHADVIVIVGGGTQINSALLEAGFAVGPHGPLGREVQSYEERCIIDRTLDGTRQKMERAVVAIAGKRERLGNVRFIRPEMDISSINGTKLTIRLNGDEMVRACYIEFDEIYVVTTESRAEKKRSQFDGLPKIAVVPFPDTPPP